jgi:tetratricopeptide (TPR) repeat protein
LLAQQKTEKQQRWILSISISLILIALISVLWINRKQENIISERKINKGTLAKKESDTLKNQHVAQNLSEKMILIDSIKTDSLPKEPAQLIALRQKADAAFGSKDYDKAKFLYEKCLHWKPKDEYFLQQIIHCVAEKKAVAQQKLQQERILKWKENKQATQTSYGKILNKYTVN